MSGEKTQGKKPHSAKKVEEDSVLKCVKCGRPLPEDSLDCFECRVSDEAERRSLESIKNLPRPSIVPWLLAFGLLLIAAAAFAYGTWHYRQTWQAADSDTRELRGMLDGRDRQIYDQEAKIRGYAKTISLISDRLEKTSDDLELSRELIKILRGKEVQPRPVWLQALPLRSFVGYGLFVNFRHFRHLDGKRSSAPFLLSGQTVQGVLATPPSLPRGSKAILEYQLDGRYRRLHGICGLEETKSPAGTKHAGKSRLNFKGGKARAEIYGDDRLLWQSRTFEWNTPPQAFDVDIGGVRILGLATEPLGKAEYDWLVWGNVILETPKVR